MLTVVSTCHCAVKRQLPVKHSAIEIPLATDNLLETHLPSGVNGNRSHQHSHETRRPAHNMLTCVFLANSEKKNKKTKQQKMT